MAAATSPLISPSSDKRFWSTLRNRVDALLESRSSDRPTSLSPTSNGGSNAAKRMKEDSLLLIRGFDSVAYSLSQLTSTLDNALQGARVVAKPPTLTEIIHNSTSNSNVKFGDEKHYEESNKVEEEDGETKAVKKRKIDAGHDCSSFGQDQGGAGDLSEREEQQKNLADKSLNKAKNLAVLMAAKSAAVAKEIKSIKSDLCFMQERCGLLEEENRRLRDGFGEGVRPDEDDLVRLQLEALLAEKSRLATENANLMRENQCLRQLVQYHQFASEDLSASYEQVIEGLCLDFSSPEAAADGNADPETPRTGGSFEFRTNLESFKEFEELSKD